MGVSAERAGGGSRARLAALAVVLLALLPSAGTLTAPWIAEDAAILAQVEADGPWADWGRSQFGMQIVRFWRPLVSTSWALQESLSGIAPAPLRSLNLALHAGVALLVFACARRLGASPAAALLSGAWVALFPEQGGTVTWLAGRTDLLCVLFLVASVHVALGTRPSRAAPLAFLACASKEFGFLAPLWIGGLAWARGDGAREAMRRALPAGVAVGAAFALRWHVLGGLDGGYPADLPGLLAGALGTARATAMSVGSPVAAVALLGCGLGARSASLRGVGAALALALASLLPLYPLLADGLLEPENRRLLFASECALALAIGCAWSRPLEGAKARGLAALALIVLGPRLAQAWSDTHAWARSASFGEESVARARAALAETEAGAGPVLFRDFARAHEGAYCLSFGVAARFRAPFPAAPRPVWPWRLAFVEQPERERAPLCTPRADGSIRPLDDPLGVPELALRGEEGAALASLTIDERSFLAAEDRSPRLALAGGPPGAPLEGVLFTELGYDPVPLGTLDGAGALSFSAMQLLAQSSGVAAVAQTLAQTADLGGRNAFLELRALGPGGEVLAASRWIELAWPADLRARAPR